LVHYELNRTNKRGGGPDVQVGTEFYLNGGSAFELKNGHWVGLVGEPALLDGDTLYTVTGTTLRAYNPKPRPHKLPGVLKKKKAIPPWLSGPSATVSVPRSTVLLRQGDQLYVAGAKSVAAWRLPLKDGAKPRWHASFEGTAAHLAADRTRL